MLVEKRGIENKLREQVVIDYVAFFARLRKSQSAREEITQKIGLRLHR
jgi:hypothetical protein